MMVPVELGWNMKNVESFTTYWWSRSLLLSGKHHLMLPSMAVLTAAISASRSKVAGVLEHATPIALNAAIVTTVLQRFKTTPLRWEFSPGMGTSFSLPPAFAHHDEAA
jgi:hypothetical protein